MNEHFKTADFDPERYWSERLAKNYTLGGVGWLGLGEEFNRWMYAVRRRVFRRAIHGRMRAADARVLDVGSGTGFYIELWQEFGVTDVAGSDLTGVAVERLQARFPGLRFERLDITAQHVDFTSRYDAVSAMDMLYHIVDDDGYRRAIRNLAELLIPGGLLLLTENLVHGETQRAEHQASRGLGEVERLLRSAGLEIESRRPVFVLMNTPVDSESMLLRHTWTAVNLLVRRGPRWGFVVGALLYSIDVVLTRLVSEGPSTEIVVCRKVDGDATVG
jgi:SAM-dependent methyltransferase